MHSDIDPDERASVLNSLIEEHARLVDTLDSLRLLARGDLAEADVFEEIDFADLIQRVNTDQEKLAPDTVINMTMPDNPPLLFGWREGVRLLLRNVIENARIHFRGSTGDHVIIDILVTVRNAELQVIIDDNGVGIPEFERDWVTGRFVRGEDANGSGSGLGLALVRQQAELHGGGLAISSSPSGGARIVIHLPIVVG
jgi:two-component system sensor histidine kinase PrrB